MSFSDIILIVVSGLGVIHGLFLSIFLWKYTKGNSLSNNLLSILLAVLSFRVGKSVFLEFAENIDVKLIYGGLGTIMAIGPLFYLFALSCANKSFRVTRLHLIQFLPSIIGVCFGLWLDESDMDTLPIWIFLIAFLIYYMHFMGYLILTFRYVKKVRSTISGDVYSLLMLFFYSLLGIWVVYVLNLFDELVPYIVGPILYSIVAYIVSFVVIRKGYIEKIDHTKYKTTSVSGEQVDLIFSKVVKLIEDQALYKSPELSLTTLSDSLHVSTQVLSMAINQKGKKNFNSFINTYRINEALGMFQTQKYSNHTVAAIAFEVGFNSISSFNTAFKKQTGQTPLAYRKSIVK